MSQINSKDDNLNERMSELYVAECMAAKARLEVETECRRLLVENYERALTQAKENSKKIEAPVLAPICEVGFFCDAHLVRTNQFTLEMGDNHYVECNIQTAEKLVARRVAEQRKQRENGLASIKIIDDKMKFAQDNFNLVSVEGGPIEIVENYDEEMEKLFYENRKKRNENKKAVAENLEKEDSKNTEHDEMMSRLEELEILEKENMEVEVAEKIPKKFQEKVKEKLEEKECPTPKPFEISLEDRLEKLEEIEEEDDSFAMKEKLLSQPGVSRKEMERLLQYLDDCENESSDNEDYDEEEMEEIEEKKVQELDSDDYASDEEVLLKAPKAPEPVRAPKVVEIEQTSTTNTVKRKRSGVRFAEQLEKVKTFLQTDTVEIKEETIIETKSILRNNTPTPVDRSALEPEQKELAAMSTVTFPGEIVEKNPYECEPSTSKDPAPVINEKKVSKFRASRNTK